jgi:dihydrofolate synthase / folylpolyglutamate synthase
MSLHSTEPVDSHDADAEYEKVVGELRARWPDANVVPSLDRELMLVDLLGSPHTSYPVVHIAGTNGKSTTTRMVDSLLRATGLRLGRFTSPEFRLSDRIALHGAPVGAEQFVELYREVAPYVSVADSRLFQRLTAFEILTAMAFAAFADAPVDAAAIEVGMGGSWDCTNVVEGAVAVITPIGLDHQRYLGDTVGEIAVEKAGIIKPGAIAVSAAQAAEAMTVIEQRCADVGATLLREGTDFAVAGRTLAVGGQVLALRGLAGRYDEVFLPLHGVHQAQNAVVALAAVEAFLGVGARTGQIDVDLVRQGFAQVTSPGRLERVSGTSPTILLDAAHNPHGMAATVAALSDEFSFSRLIGVVSVLADKDAGGVLRLLEPVLDMIVCTRNSSPRAIPAEALGALAVEIFGDDRVRVEPSLPDAIDMAVALASTHTATRVADGEGAPGDLTAAGAAGAAGTEGAADGAAGIVVTGSVATVGDARTLLMGRDGASGGLG